MENLSKKHNVFLKTAVIASAAVLCDYAIWLFGSEANTESFWYCGNWGNIAAIAAGLGLVCVCMKTDKGGFAAAAAVLFAAGFQIYLLALCVFAFQQMKHKERSLMMSALSVLYTVYFLIHIIAAFPGSWISWDGGECEFSFDDGMLMQYVVTGVSFLIALILMMRNRKLQNAVSIRISIVFFLIGLIFTYFWPGSLAEYGIEWQWIVSYIIHIVFSPATLLSVCVLRRSELHAEG